jgi:hypothetical protein
MAEISRSLWANPLPKNLKSPSYIKVMELSELLTIHASTLLIVGVSIWCFLELLRRYKENKTLGSLLLCIFLLIIVIDYSFNFMLRFPTPEVNLVKFSGKIIPFTPFLCVGILPYFGSLFALYVFKPKYMKVWVTILTCLTGIYVIILSIYPPFISKVRPEVFEWIIAGLTAKYFWVCGAMSYIPSLLFLAYSIKTKIKIQKMAGYFLLVGFFMVACLIEISDTFGIFPPIGIRRVLIAVALILIYLGFTMPVWLKKVLGY